MLRYIHRLIDSSKGTNHCWQKQVVLHRQLITRRKTSGVLRVDDSNPQDLRPREDGHKQLSSGYANGCGNAQPPNHSSSPFGRIWTINDEREGKCVVVNQQFMKCHSYHHYLYAYIPRGGTNFNILTASSMFRRMLTFPPKNTHRSFISMYKQKCK